MFIAQVTVPLLHRLITLGLAVTVLGVAVELVRRRKLREEYALLWLAASGMLTILAAAPEMVFWLQSKLQVNFLTLLLMGFGLFAALIVMHLSVVASRQQEEIRKLAQKIALMQEETERKRKAGTGEAEAGRRSNPETARTAGSPESNVPDERNDRKNARA